MVKILSGLPGRERARRHHRHADRALIENVDQRQGLFRDQRHLPAGPRRSHLRRQIRLRDYRGGGRQSARETAARVAAGAIARKIVPGMMVRGALIQIGPHEIDRARWDWSQVEQTRSSAPTRQCRFSSIPRRRAQAGSSVGAVIEVVAEKRARGLGAPVYGKLDADLAAR
jgi:chorismate synthase